MCVSWRQHTLDTITAVVMAILAYGINYRTAPLELREQLAFPADDLGAALVDLTGRVPSVGEAAILSTCNRTELYCSVNDSDSTQLRNWLAEHRQLAPADFDDHVYAHWETDAASHVIRVAAGLDSQVLGEPQIMGQMKAAWEQARTNGAMGPELNLLSDVSLNAAKRIRTETDVGKNPVSVAFASVSLARTIFSNLQDTRALLLGAGETIELVAEHLVNQGIGGLAVANRSLPNARAVAEKFAGRAMLLTDLGDVLHDYDMVIASTGSSLPVLGKGTVEAALRKRKQRPMFMVDIAVPRDIEAEVAELRDVYLYTIDDLTQIIEQNNAERKKAAEGAEKYVEEGAADYLRKRRLQDAGAMLSSLRAQAGEVQNAEVQKALLAFAKDGDAEAAMNALARNLTNKLMHAPTQALRNASAQGRSDLVDFLRSAYGLKQGPK